MITYRWYRRLGYERIPQTGFARWAAYAEAVVTRNTFGRVTAENASVNNRRGAAEIAEAYYDWLAGAAGALRGFRNEGYAEDYPGADESARMCARRVEEALRAFYTAGQLYRGANEKSDI